MYSRHFRCRGLAAYVAPVTSIAALCLAGCAAEESPPPVTVAPMQAAQPQVAYVGAAPPRPSGAPEAVPLTYDTAASLPVTAAPTPQFGVTANHRSGLPYGEFLANAEDEAKRQFFWSLFHEAEAEARAFASSPGRWIPVVRVEYGRPGQAAGDWSPSGVIVLKQNADPGLLFHETFHPAFHASEFHTSASGAILSDDRDGAWSEAFCDAFRYYAQRQFLPGQPSRWLHQMDHRLTLTEQAALGANGGSWSTRKYTYPASLIIKRAGGAKGSIATLRALWFQLLRMRAQQGTPVMDQFFGFAPPIHKSDMP